MITINNIDVSGFEAAVRGMRNPLASWKKADSHWAVDEKPDGVQYTYFKIGPNDLDLAKRLTLCGSSDRKFLRMIHVTMDISAPLFWWKEADQYKISTTTDSCSTMHKIQRKEFTLDDFTHEHMNDESLKLLEQTIKHLNKYRDLYNESKPKNKDYWWQMIESLPSSFNQMRTWDLNYETLIGIYFSRRNHKLDDWHTVCDMILTLPYMKDLIEVLDKKEGTE